MEDYFAEIQQPHTQYHQYNPPPAQSNHQFDSAFPTQPSYNHNVLLNPTQTLGLQQNFDQHDLDNQFDQFEEDQVAKRIREDEEKVQNRLREKSEKEWEDKKARQEEGKKLLEEYLAKKDTEKQERAAENIRKQALIKEENAKLNVEAGWRKVITNINIRQGERKGSKDTNRMREAILHRREDDAK